MRLALHPVTVERQHVRYEQNLRVWLDSVRRRDTCPQLMMIPDTSYEQGSVAWNANWPMRALRWRERIISALSQSEARRRQVFCDGEYAVLSLVLAAIFFAGIHFGVAGTTLRDRAIAALNQTGYRIAFSLASVLGLAWLVAAYNRAPYIAAWGMLEWWKPFAIILMLPASLLVVIGLTTPNPTSVAQEGRLAQPPRGIVRVTRHPFLTGVGLWALVHLVGDGDVASLVFFATWAVVALAGTVSIDRKRRRLLGATWELFAAQTSIVPFAAIAAGRNRFRLSEIGAWRWGVALVVYALMLGGHAHVIGVSPFPA